MKHPIPQHIRNEAFEITVVVFWASILLQMAILLGQDLHHDIDPNQNLYVITIVAQSLCLITWLLTGTKRDIGILLAALLAYSHYFVNN